MDACGRCGNGVLVATTRGGKRVALEPRLERTDAGFDGYTLDAKGIADYIPIHARRSWNHETGHKRGHRYHKCGNLSPSESRAALRSHELKERGAVVRLGVPTQPTDDWERGEKEAHYS